MKNFKFKILSFKIKNDGFTLIEILIAAAIITGLTLAISYFAIDVSKLQFFISQSLAVDQEIDLTFKTMAPEIRSIGPSSNGGYPIAAASSSSLSFYSDIDNDGLFEQVRYFLEGATFKKGVIKPNGNPLAYNQADEKISEMIHGVISSNIFSYFDKNYDGTKGSSLTIPVDTSIIRLVKIKITADQDIKQEPGSQTLSTTFEIRNLRGL